MHTILDSGKLEIAMLTYNRSQCVKDWMEKYLVGYTERNIKICVYDSSPNNDTEVLLKEFQKNNKLLDYVKVDSTARIDDKIMVSLLNATSEYVWPLGDSRGIDIRVFDEKIIPAIEQNYNYINFYHSGNNHRDGTEFTQPIDFFQECFPYFTWLGGTIFERDIFSVLKDENVKDEFDKKYYRNDGFSYLGIFFDLIVEHNYIGIYKEVEITEFQSRKTPQWMKRYFEVWCDNLIYLIDNMSEYYLDKKEFVIKDIWNKVNLDCWQLLITARKNGGLNCDIYKHYSENGYLGRVSDHINRIKFIACAPEPIVACLYFGNHAMYRIKNIVKRIIRRN